MAFFYDDDGDDSDDEFDSCPECGAETSQSDLDMAGMCEDCSISEWESDNHHCVSCDEIFDECDLDYRGYCASCYPELIDKLK